MYVTYRNSLYFRLYQFSSGIGMTKINHMKIVYTVVTMGLVKTKFLLIEHLEIDIFADEN